MCRTKEERNNIIFIKDKLDTKICNKKIDIKMSKQDKIIDIIQNKKDGKFIIFSSYDETFFTIRYVLEEHSISYAEVQGRVETRHRKNNIF